KSCTLRITAAVTGVRGRGRQALRERYQDLFEQYQVDALIFPTTCVVAPLANEEVNLPSNFARLIQNTEPSASAGLPGIQLPIGLGSRSGLPVGIELDGPAWSDRRLLAIGQALESIFGRIPRA
uniref:amidase family protein n=1 Tax=Zestomonas thermotolerans TaxID=157784 RepID=UPI0023F49567